MLSVGVVSAAVDVLVEEGRENYGGAVVDLDDTTDAYSTLDNINLEIDYENSQAVFTITTPAGMIGSTAGTYSGSVVFIIDEDADGTTDWQVSYEPGSNNFAFSGVWGYEAALGSGANPNPRNFIDATTVTGINVERIGDDFILKVDFDVLGGCSDYRLGFYISHITEYDGMGTPGAADQVMIFYPEYSQFNWADTDSFTTRTVECPPPCELIIDEPFDSILGYMNNDQAYFDSEAVPIKWHLEGDTCTPIDLFYLFYQKDGICDPDTGAWNFIPGTDGGLTQGQIETDPYQYLHLWDKPMESGQYCVKIKVTSNGARDVSEHFNVDLAPPKVSLAVGAPHVGECDVDETGDCYVTQNTDITITCEDNDPSAPWQSGVNYMEYRYQVNGGVWTSWTPAPDSFTFPEDSNHMLEYRCYDNVGKVDSGEKAFIVDTVAPVFVEKTIGEPQYCEGIDCEMYVTQDTEICLTYEDPTPHPVGDVQVYCDVTWRLDDPFSQKAEKYKITTDEFGCFKFEEDSYHSVHCWAEDALGNWNELEDVFEQDIVDTQAPTTWLIFEGPYYYDGTSQWIDTESRIVLEAEDPQPHPVEGVTTYYRYEIVDDSWCYKTSPSQWQETSKEDSSWMEYSGEFPLPESCHVIEYYSVDALGNSEYVEVKFVFSDHTAPALDLDVGASGKNCDNIFVSCEPEWDWKITTQTEVIMSCSDQEPHPSGVDELCYRIAWDGGDIDEQVYYQGGYFTDGGYYCVPTDTVTISFAESCQHTLDFYCTDNVDKTSDVMTTIFKVNGVDFTIVLDQKWNLISVPVNLLSSHVEEVFGNDGNVEEVWSYENGAWYYYIPGDASSTLEYIVPGRGYWVKTSAATNIVVGGSLFEEAMTPNSIPMNNGWNLIGHYGIVSKESYCSLFSLVDTTIGFPRWSSLVGYDSSNKQFTYLDSMDDTNPGEGYWLEMDVEDNYSYATNCWGFS